MSSLFHFSMFFSTFFIPIYIFFLFILFYFSFVQLFLFNRARILNRLNISLHSSIFHFIFLFNFGKTHTHTLTHIRYMWQLSNDNLQLMPTEFTMTVLHFSYFLLSIYFNSFLFFYPFVFIIIFKKICNTALLHSRRRIIYK